MLALEQRMRLALEPALLARHKLLGLAQVLRMLPMLVLGQLVLQGPVLE